MIDITPVAQDIGFVFGFSFEIIKFIHFLHYFYVPEKVKLNLLNP